MPETEYIRFHPITECMDLTKNLLEGNKAIITLFFAWIASKNEQAKRKQMFEDAKQRIELINAYVASQKLVFDDSAELGAMKKAAASELYNIRRIWIMNSIVWRNLLKNQRTIGSVSSC